jgi:kinesin family protein C2/C3
MPEIFPAITMAEREAELKALQSAFDEYIASSRELEEELDAELAKMQDKLAESTAANRALSAQLENIAPQLNSLEAALTESRKRLKEEQELRRKAEAAQDDCEQRLRETEESLQHVREECDAVHEELAFKESEIEEARLELEVEKQQLLNELEDMKRKWHDAEARSVSNARSMAPLVDDSSSVGAEEPYAHSNGHSASSPTVIVPSTDVTSHDAATTSAVSAAPALRARDSVDSVPSLDDGYVKKLEEELEIVTEQLIETENRLSETEGQVQALRGELGRALEQQGMRSEEDDELIRQLQTENADRLENEQKLLEDLALVKDELSLAKEEITLTQEELQAIDEERKALELALEEEQVKHREDVTQLTIQVKEAEVESKTSLGEAALVASNIQRANAENEELRHQVAALEAALKLAKQDYQSVLEELEAVNIRFDEARIEAQRAGREVAIEELRDKMKADVEHEVSTMKFQLLKLAQENSTLQEKVDETEIALAALRDSQEDRSSALAADAEVHSEVVKQLQSQLSRAKEELSKKDAEMAALTNNMEERLRLAEDRASKVESDLHTTKGQLAEAEARVSVLRLEKDRLENTTHIPQSPPRSHKVSAAAPTTGQRGLPPTPPSLTRLSIEDREELMSIDDDALARRLRTPRGERSRSSSPSSVMKLEYRLQEEKKKYSELQRDYDLLQDQKRMGEVRIKRLEEDLRLLHKELFSHGGDTAITTQMSRLSSLATSTRDKEVDLIVQPEADETQRINDIIGTRDVKLVAEELRSIEKKYNAQREYNAQLLSKMLHLQGNIQVYCRVRPMTISEMQRGYKEVVESLSETEVGCFDSRTNKWKSFAYDRVWGPDQSQQSVFQDVEPLALSVVDGFNACIFAYGQTGAFRSCPGSCPLLRFRRPVLLLFLTFSLQFAFSMQTGSGKTYTMEGVPDQNQYGISYRTIQKIFHLLNLRAQQQRAAEMFVGSDGSEQPDQVAFNFSMEIGMLEIYNDEVYDLLTAQGSSMAEKKMQSMLAGGKASLDIRRSKEGRIEVPSLTKEKVSSIQEVMALLKRGNSNRATAATDMNEHSSRSHMVLIVDVMSGLGESYSNRGSLFLVDLAGCERVRKSHVEGDQLKEAGFINKSLSALGNVMEALDRKASHVPYRDSKLTYLLQDALGGNSRTMMVVTICPVDTSYDESINALQFAARVRRIQIGAAQRNVTSKNLEETVKALTEEMRALTRAKERSETQLLSLKRDNARVQDKLKNLSQAKQQSRNDTKTLEVLRKNNDEMAARWQKEKAAKDEAITELDNVLKEQRHLQQQLGQLNSKVKTLTSKLEEKENELESVRMRQERSKQSASNVRARRDQVLGSRTPGVLQLPSTPSRSTTVSSSNRAAIPASSTPRARPSTSASDASTTEASDSGAGSIRAQVLALLEKHDQGKVNRIDIIMEKFKGKEALLLEKMTQRYEGSASAGGKVPFSADFQKRNELALQRHHERMQRYREGRDSNGAVGSSNGSAK